MEINKKILIIDDQIEILETLKKILGNRNSVNKIKNQLDDLLEDFFEKEEKEEENYQVITADRGKKGYELIKKSLEEEKPFALAMIDMRMPEWDGLETAKKIRELDENIELVMVTAYSDRTREEILEAVKIPEKLLYLKKPFDRDEILQIALSLTMKWSLDYELKKKNEELRLRNKKLEIANKLNKKITVVSSHELRTPITLISGYIQLLESGLYDKEERERKKMYSNLNTSTNRLIKIVNGMLENFATSDKAENIIIKSDYFNIEDILEETKVEVENFLRIRNQKLEIEIEKDLKLVYVDKHKLINFILINLLMNAIKYSKDNSTIKVVAKKENEKCKIAIKDEGIGVVNDNLNYIFSPFFVGGDNSHHHSGVYEFKSSGIGLGLTIVENTLNLMGESIRCISKRGEGSIFEFTVPMKK